MNSTNHKCVLCKKRRADNLGPKGWKRIDCLVEGDRVPGAWLPRVKAAIKSAFMGVKGNFWIQDICSLCLIAAVKNYMRRRKADAEKKPLNCPRCKYTCPTNRGLQAHISHVHESHPYRLSRQRVYQLRHRAKGLCSLCSSPIVKSGMCKIHYQKTRDRVLKSSYGPWWQVADNLNQLRKEQANGR